jgi:hypothetical protein
MTVAYGFVALIGALAPGLILWPEHPALALAAGPLSGSLVVLAFAMAMAFWPAAKGVSHRVRRSAGAGCPSTRRRLIH